MTKLKSVVKLPENYREANERLYGVDFVAGMDKMKDMIGNIVSEQLGYIKREDIELDVEKMTKVIAEISKYYSCPYDPEQVAKAIAEAFKKGEI